MAIQQAYRRYRLLKRAKENREKSPLSEQAEADGIEETASATLSASTEKELPLADYELYQAAEELSFGKKGNLQPLYNKAAHQIIRYEPIQWTLPEGDEKIARQLAGPIKKGEYENINYRLPDFSINLLYALKLGLIDKDEFLSAHHMYDLLLSINNNEIPPNPRALLRRYMLSTDDGQPYSPLAATGGKNPKVKERLVRQIKKGKKEKKPLSYYALTLPYHQQITILYDQLGESHQNKKLPPHRLKMLEGYIRKQKIKLIREKELTEGQADNLITLYLKAAKNCDVPEKRRDLRQFMLLMEKEWAPFLDKRPGYRDRYAHLFDDVRTERDSIGFLDDIDATNSGIPGLCSLDSDDADNFVALCVAPTRVLNTVMVCLYEKDAIHLVPQIGGSIEVGQSMRMVRAWHDLPERAHAYKPDLPSRVDENLSILYPSASYLSAPSRPVEIVFPGLGKPPPTHTHHVYPAIRTMHDFYHAMLASKTKHRLVILLEGLHDDKAGLAVSHSGMSNALDPLVDLEYKSPELVLSIKDSGSSKTKIRLHELMAIMNVFEKSHFVFYPSKYTSERHDDRYLIVFDMLTSPKKWSACLYDRTPEDLFSPASFKLIYSYIPDSHIDLKPILKDFEKALSKNDYERCEAILKTKIHDTPFSKIGELNINQYLSMALEQKKMAVFLEQHKALGLIGYVLSEKLSPMEKADWAMLYKMKELGYEHFFDWTRNTGIFFNKALRGSPPFDRDILKTIERRESSQKEANLRQHFRIKPKFSTKNVHEMSPYRVQNLSAQELRALLAQAKATAPDGGPWKNMMQCVGEKKEQENTALKAFEAVLTKCDEPPERQALYIKIYRACQPLTFSAQLFMLDFSDAMPTFAQSFYHELFQQLGKEPDRLNKVKEIIFMACIDSQFSTKDKQDPLIGSRIFLVQATQMALAIKSNKGILSISDSPIESLGYHSLQTHLKSSLREVNQVKRLCHQISSVVQRKFLDSAILKARMPDLAVLFLKESMRYFPPLTLDELGEKIPKAVAQYIDLNARYMALSRLALPQELPALKEYFTAHMAELVSDISDPAVKKALLENIKLDCSDNINHFMHTTPEKGVLDKASALFSAKKEEPLERLDSMLFHESEKLKKIPETFKRPEKD
jgi:hypothetical protein